MHKCLINLDYWVYSKNPSPPACLNTRMVRRGKDIETARRLRVIAACATRASASTSFSVTFIFAGMRRSNGGKRKEWRIVHSGTRASRPSTLPSLRGLVCQWIGHGRNELG